MGGGGTQTATSNSGLPDWARPYVENSLADATDLYSAGAFEHVQGLTPEQQEGLERQKQLGAQGGIYDNIAQDSYGATQAYRDAASGQGLFGANALGQQTQALQDSIGKAQQLTYGQGQGTLSGGGGARGSALGSARGQASLDAAALQVGGDLAAKELAQRRSAALTGAQGTLGAGSTLQSQFGTGASTVGQVGSQLQQQQQNEGDAAYQGIQRLFGLYSEPSIGKSTTQTTTGGGK